MGDLTGALDRPSCAALWASSNADEPDVHKSEDDRTIDHGGAMVMLVSSFVMEIWMMVMMMILMMMILMMILMMIMMMMILMMIMIIRMIAILLLVLLLVLAFLVPSPRSQFKVAK